MIFVLPNDAMFMKKIIKNDLEKLKNLTWEEKVTRRDDKLLFFRGPKDKIATADL